MTGEKDARPRKWMPIQDGLVNGIAKVPFSMFDNESAREWCETTFRSTPETLARVGGLDPQEAASVLLGVPFDDAPSYEASIELVRERASAAR